MIVLFHGAPAGRRGRQGHPCRGTFAELGMLLVPTPSWPRRGSGTTTPRGMSRTLLHVVADWPGHFPNGAAIVEAAGARRRRRGRALPRSARGETPLHWAASCNDVAVLDALLDVGADIEAPGSVLRRRAAALGRDRLRAVGRGAAPGAAAARNDARRPGDAGPDGCPRARPRERQAAGRR
jgi:hypothetical protein